MGGFLGGLGSALAGAGAAAAPYRDRLIDVWQNTRNHLADMIATELGKEFDPQRRADLLQQELKLRTAKPGTDLNGVIKSIHETANVHPNSEALLGQIGAIPQGPKPAGPAPAGPGQVPGVQQVQQPEPGPFENAIAAPAAGDQGSASTPFSGMTLGGIENGKAPAPPPAAAPDTNPIAGPKTITPPPPGPIAPVAGAPYAGAYTQALSRFFPEGLENATPAKRAYFQPALEAAGAKDIDLEAGFQNTKRLTEYKLDKLKKIGMDLNTPIGRMAAAGALGISMPGVAGAAFNPLHDVTDAATLEAQHPGILAKFHIDPTKTPTVRIQRSKLDDPYSEPSLVEGITPQVVPITDVSGAQTFAPKISGNEAGVAPGQLNVRQTGIDPVTGQPTFASVQDIRNGTAQMGVSPSALPSVSTQSSPGAPPVTTVRTRVPGAAKGAGIPPVGGGSVPPRAGANSIGEREYNQVMQGGPMPTGREMDAMKDYVDKSGKQMPIVLSQGGQKAIATIDPVLAEITRTKQMLQKSIQNGLTKADLARDYAKYHILKIDSPNTELIANLSFSGLRSAIQALSGSGSRALPILQKALEHAPELGINPTDPRQALKLLNEMETRVKEGRQSVYDDERRNGIVPPVGAPAGGGRELHFDAQGNLVH